MPDDLFADLLVFTDLDDTLIQTERKIHLKQKPFETPVNVVQEGSGVKPTFLLDHQRKMLDWLSLGNVIPVTGRDLRAFQALQIPSGNHAILNHGATVLLKQDGQWIPDPGWTGRMQEEAQTYRTLLEEALALLQGFQNDPEQVFHRIIHEGDLPICTVSKVKNLPESALRDLLQQVQEKLGEGPYYVHLNGNNLSFIPDAVRKKHAVLYLQEKLQASLSIGIGDSHTDLEFMEVCDFWMTPRKSQIQQLVHTQEHP